MWQYLEGLYAPKDEGVDVDMEHLLLCTEQTILLLEQTLNTAICYWRYKALSSIIPNTEWLTVKEESEVQGNDGYLFEKEQKGRKSNDSYFQTSEEVWSTLLTKPLIKLSKKWWVAK